MDPAAVLRLAAVLAVVAGCLAAAEWADPESLAYGGERRRHDPVERRRHLWWLAAYFVVAPLVGLVAGTSVSFAHRHSPLTETVREFAWPWQLVLAFVVGDGVAYALHRCMHRVPLLWHLHVVHHSATDVRWWTAFRFHPADTLLAHTVPYTIAAWVGVGGSALAVYVMAVMVVTLLAHADVFVPGAWLQRAVVTPAFHRRHHEVEGSERNFGLVLPVFDMVCRTAWFGPAAPRYFGARRDA